MRLPFFNKSGNEGKTFFGLFLKEQQGIGFVMKMKDANIILIDQEKFTYSNGWEHVTEAIDEVILKLEQRTKTKLHETIFFIYSHFIDEKTKDIKKVYLDKVKDLVKRLNLKALGYIEAYEAVLHYLEKKEELPLTAILIELDHSNLSVFVYRRGELTYLKVLAHTDKLIDDLLMSFMEIKGRFVLPSRIILYNSKDLDNESTEIVTYRWSEELFIQLPRVEIVKEHELIQGLLEVFAEQYGKNTTGAIFTEAKPKEEVMGFVIGGDVAKAKNIKEEIILPARISSTFIADKISSFTQKILTLPKIINKRWTVLAGIILILAGLFLNEYFFHRATLTLFLPSKSIKKDLSVTSDNLTISTDSKTVDLKDSKPTTGKKEIGEKAKGSITLHNFDDSEKTFAKGTSLETGGLKFSLDQEVKIASASVVTINGGVVKQPGKAKVGATADTLGNQSNIASGKQFKIADLSSSQYFGLNESAFTGGTKKDLKTVAKKDMDDLLKNIGIFAKKQKTDLSQAKKNSDAKILTQLTEVEIAKEKFDKEVGEEADTISLQAEVKLTAYSYTDKEMKDVILKILTKDAEKGFELSNNKLSYSIKDAAKKGNEVTINVSSDAKSIKDVSADEVIKKVSGKNTGNLKNLLTENFKIEGYELTVKPKIPLLQNLMPFFEKNITIKISSL